MGALEAMLEGLGVSLNFEPGGLGFASYGALEKLYHSDIDGAVIDINIALHDALLKTQPPEVEGIIRQLLEADMKDWFDIIKDGVLNSLAEGMLRESIKSAPQLSGIDERILSQLYTALVAIWLHPAEVMDELLETVEVALRVATEWVDSTPYGLSIESLLVRAFLQAGLTAFDHRAENVTVILTKVGEVVVPFISDSDFPGAETAGTILQSIVDAATGRCRLVHQQTVCTDVDIGTMLETWLTTLLRAVLPSSPGSISKILLETAGVPALDDDETGTTDTTDY